MGKIKKAYCGESPSINFLPVHIVQNLFIIFSDFLTNFSTKYFLTLFSFRICATQYRVGDNRT